MAYQDEMDELWTAALRRAAGHDEAVSTVRLAGMFGCPALGRASGGVAGRRVPEGFRRGQPRSAVQLRVTAHRAGVLEWIRSMSRQTGDELARKLALLLEGALALTMGTLDPDTPRLAHDAARQIIHEGLPQARIKALSGDGIH
ncbi:hypothetical protein QFZ23_002518 [Arthrobacter globiformis]|uniref:hypothetical protein n=1 Tax=Arthrobacter globiformis TaxID=1665 RepID=UPI00278620B6|nr:hypothetical protein [Arthrobacter globiformis]MDQ1058617.1 hypothetical protein [Arthrobacter globiformis]